jgi:excinuclease ABC subunit B
MQGAIDESNRRRSVQLEYNKVHHITPSSIQKNIDDILRSPYEADYVTVPVVAEAEGPYETSEDISEMIKDLKEKMKEAGRRLEFEEAILLRDQIKTLEKRELEVLFFG